MADTKISAMTAATAATASTVPVVQGGVNKKVEMTGAGAAMIEAATSAAQLTLLFSANGAASTPAASLVGTVFTGGSATTTKPLFLIEPTGTTSTNWSTNGTLLGVNAASGFTGDLLNLQLAAVDRFKIGLNGKFAFNYTNADGILGSMTSIYGTINIRTDGVSTFFVDKPLGTLSGNLLIASNSGQLTFGLSNDVILARKAAAVLQLGADAAGVTNQMFTAASRITSDGVGADLTIAAGNGRGGAGGSLILSTYTTAGASTIGTLTSRYTIDTAGVTLIANATTVPSATPSGGGYLYVEAGALKWKGSSATVTTIAAA